MSKLESVLRGIKIKQACSSPKSAKRLPITMSVLRSLKSHIIQSAPSHDQLMLWAAACTCFFGFLRARELTVPSEATFDPTVHLCVWDVSVDSIHNPQILKVQLKASKTDPFRKGVEVVIGRAGEDVCPIRSLLSYLAVRGGKPGCLFQFQDGRLLTKQIFVARIRHALQLAGLNPKEYAGHSFKSGAATTAAARGLGDATIKMLGRWESSAYQVYIKTSRDKLANYSHVLGKQ